MDVNGTSDRGQASGLRIRHLSKTFKSNGNPHQVLVEIDLMVDPGAFVVIVGPSGCGKSTLLRIVAGLEKADPHPEAELTLSGEVIHGPGPDRGFVFQSYSSFPWLTAKENVMFGLQFSVVSRAERERIARSYLDLVGLLDHEDFYPRDLSGGQQQRVAIARTLATRPRLLLMDEPFAALDAFNREYQQSELLRVWRETSATILFVTHDITEAVFLGTRVVVLSRRPGRVIADIDVEGALRERLGEVDATGGKKQKRGPWLRQRAEFYELMAQLKKSLPGLDVD